MTKLLVLVALAGCVTPLLPSPRSSLLVPNEPDAQIHPPVELKLPSAKERFTEAAVLFGFLVFLGGAGYAWERAEQRAK